jgi:hypothetical protein
MPEDDTIAEMHSMCLLLMSQLTRLLSWTEARSIEVQYDSKHQTPEHDKT